VTLREYPNLEQRSDDWHQLRCGLVTASTIGKLVTPKTLKPASNDMSRSHTVRLATERITGQVEETFTSNDMWRGIVCEPIARDYYQLHYAPVDEFGMFIREQDGWKLGYSPDGLVGDDGLLEIKAPRPHNHVQTILDGNVPAEYMPQLQTALYVTRRAWIDFVSFAGGLPLFVLRVLPDERWFEAIEATVALTETNINKHLADWASLTADLHGTDPVDLDDFNKVELKL